MATLGTGLLNKYHVVKCSGFVNTNSMGSGLDKSWPYFDCLPVRQVLGLSLSEHGGSAHMSPDN